MLEDLGGQEYFFVIAAVLIYCVSRMKGATEPEH